jgi:hypothetical protein
MITQRITNTSVIAAIAIATIALVVGLSQTQTTTAADTPVGNNAYVFAEGVYPQATFKFKDTTVTYEFQAFTQVSNLIGSNGRSSTPEFTLQRIAGETPYLHQAVDEAFQNAGRIGVIELPYQEFDVEIELIQAGEDIRAFEYADCQISNYKTVTEFDKEEGYTTGGKTGFAVMETFTFGCAGFEPVATTFDDMMNARGGNPTSQ